MSKPVDLADQRLRALEVLVEIAEDEVLPLNDRISAAATILSHYVATVTNPF